MQGQDSRPIVRRAVGAGEQEEVQLHPSMHILRMCACVEHHREHLFGLHISCWSLFAARDLKTKCHLPLACQVFFVTEDAHVKA